jgi:hypothetical protein
MTIIPIAAKNVPYVWKDCERLFAAFPNWKIRTFDPADALEKIMSGHCSLHAAFSDNGHVIAACITHVERYPNGNSLYIDAFGGDDFMDWQQEGFKYLEETAKELGCGAVEYLGRAGFSKLDPTYQEDGRLYVKMIGENNNVKN